MKKGYLILQDGQVFEGVRFGAETDTVGELVFTTGMCGYVETLTDPSYAGQIVMQTYPLIGNYGIIREDFEGACCVKGYVVREYCDTPSNFRTDCDLDTYLKEQGVPGLFGVDTRELTRIIREHGVMNAAICDEIPADLTPIETYAVTGVPTPPLEPLPEPDPEPEPEPTPVDYGYNMLDIDFTALAESTGDSTLASLHRYMAARTPSRRNQYTGMFAGKNLILLTAESFSPWFISQELTPTLYRLTHEGFVFTNYYQPGWGQSTTGGEFAHMTGIIPTWVNGNLSFYASHQDYMPFALGNQFRALGYTTVAYHNNSYTYYNRHLTHPNLGYDYYGQGNGLTLTVPGWPYSDLEMMELTAPAYIEDYVNTGKPFHAYYMSVSGHANWGWGNAMSAKNREAAVAAYPNASQPVQGYIAANLELEYALTYLLEQLEAAGIADDTVICMTADHYPYALVTDEVDYYQELSGKQDSELDISRYKNTWLLWSGSMESSVTVNTPCSAIDILPTVSNLFGLEFDSRLMSGHDVFAQNYNASQASTCMPLVILPTNRGYSWITAAGTYDAKTRTFTPNPGITVADDYVKTVSSLIDAKYSYARQLIQYDYAGVVLHHPQATHVMAAPPKPPEPSTDETADDTVNEGYVDDTGTGDTTE